MLLRRRLYLMSLPAAVALVGSAAWAGADFAYRYLKERSL